MTKVEKFPEGFSWRKDIGGYGMVENPAEPVVPYIGMEPNIINAFHVVNYHLSLEGYRLTTIDQPEPPKFRTEDGTHKTDFAIRISGSARAHAAVEFPIDQIPSARIF